MTLMPTNPLGGIDAQIAQILAMQAPMQGAPAEAFQWGQGGARLSPDDIARRRAMADQQMQSDYSPVSHWTQGAGRVLDGLLGGIESNKLDKQSEQLQAQRGVDIAALLGQGNADLAGAFGSGDKVLEALAGDVLQSRTPKAKAPSQFEQELIASGMQPGTPEWTQAFKTKVANTLDPFTNLVSGGESFTGRQSLVQQALTGGGGQTSSGPDWTAAFSPEELRVMQGEAQRRMAGQNVPQGSPLNGGPSVGAIVDGYRFKGGDPKAQANWEQVR